MDFPTLTFIYSIKWSEMMYYLLTVGLKKFNPSGIKKFKTPNTYK